jgi:hypothetical protein
LSEVLTHGVDSANRHCRCSVELARDYDFTDVDGERPDWDGHDIDFGRDAVLLDYIRTG